MSPLATGLIAAAGLLLVVAVLFSESLVVAGVGLVVALVLLGVPQRLTARFRRER
ncbi:hypothetical protein [Patulibacter defluvii]|uniref:hypothetical protein n=1 Tax=Patulibacter defluvii TaxID=3095358 RepID=UPI002A759C0D|nr:hypothetical protein [Patulibacter sp. DM4]